MFFFSDNIAAKHCNVDLPIARANCNKGINTEWFSMQDCVIHARGISMSRDFQPESVKILEPQASVFLRFPKVEQHPKCMDHAILLGKPFGNCFIK
jgi:hypothetical protein